MQDRLTLIKLIKNSCAHSRKSHHRSSPLCVYWMCVWMHVCLCVCGFAPGPLSPLCLRQDFSCLRCGGIICFDFNREGCWCWWCVRGLFLIFSYSHTLYTPSPALSLPHTHIPILSSIFLPYFFTPSYHAIWNEEERRKAEAAAAPAARRGEGGVMSQYN